MNIIGQRDKESMLQPLFFIFVCLFIIEETTFHCQQFLTKKINPLFSKTKTENKIQQRRLWRTESGPNFSSHHQATVFLKSPNLSRLILYKTQTPFNFLEFFFFFFFVFFLFSKELIKISYTKNIGIKIRW